MEEVDISKGAVLLHAIYKAGDSMSMPHLGMLKMLDSLFLVKYGPFENFGFTQLQVCWINVLSRQVLNTCIG